MIAPMETDWSLVSERTHVGYMAVSACLIKIFWWSADGWSSSAKFQSDTGSMGFRVLGRSYAALYDLDGW